MIRFIDLKKQYWGIDEYNEEDISNRDEFRDEFAFIDTVTDRFIDVNGNQFWDCWGDFAEDYKAGGWRGMELERFKPLVNDKFFRPSETE